MKSDQDLYKQLRDLPKETLWNTEVVRFNAADAATKALYDELSPRLPGLLDDLFARTELPKRLSDCGVPAAAIPMLAEEAAKQWTAQFNPQPVTVADFITLYESLL